MALSRRSVQRMSGSIWPGFVDAMTALLLVLMFVLTIFMIVQFMLSETITGQESELDELTSEVNALAQALGLEQQKSFTLEEQVNTLGATLEVVSKRAEDQSGVIAALTSQLETQSQALNQRDTAIAGLEEQVAAFEIKVASFEETVAALLVQRDDAQGKVQQLSQENEQLEISKNALISETEAMQLALASARDEIDAQVENARLAAARRQALDALLADLRGRVASSESTLSQALSQLEISQAEAAALKSDLSDTVAALGTERDVAAALRARLSGVEQELTEQEAARLADAAAATLLREKLKNADDELTAMTLAMEEQRREAEEMLTVIAAAKAADSDLNAKLAAALLAGQEVESKFTEAQAAQQDASARLAVAEAALAAALEESNRFKSQQEESDRARLAAESRLDGVEQALADALNTRDGLRSELAIQVQTEDEISTRLAAVEAALTAMQQERDGLQATLDTLTMTGSEQAAYLAKVESELQAARAEISVLRATDLDQASIRDQLTAALAAKLAAENAAKVQMTTAEQRAALLSTANQLLQEEEAKSADGLRRMAVLNRQIVELRKQIGSLQALLEVAEAKDREANIEITNLSSRLNSALARVLAEERARAELEAAERERLQAEAKQLENYRSEFFGKMREVLGDREGVRIVGDRFVFSSEVLFEPASADLAQDGKSQIARVAEILSEVSSAIPPEIDWVIRVDGHTDVSPLSGTGRYVDNWELSQARALSVVRFMTDELLFPASRLAATGFGEFQPVALGDTPEALAQNRRIELKLTER